MSNQAIYGALSKVQAYLQENPISKDGKNSFQKYNYRGIDQVYETFSPVLAQNSILTVLLGPNGEERPLVSAAAEGKKSSTTIEGTLRLLSLEDGSYVDTAYLGQSTSVQGKDLQAARSFAYRDALIQTFCVPFEGTVEPEEEELPPTNPDEQDEILLKQFEDQLSSSADADGKKAIYNEWIQTTEASENNSLRNKITIKYTEVIGND